MSFNLGLINEAIAAAIPDREAMVTSRRRFTWSDVARRSRKLANLLRAAGLGCHRERADLQPWESGQDHLALYLYNGHEYMEGMLGAYKARVAPFNVNYRYVAEELLYVLRDASTRALVFHASFAPLLREVLPKLPTMKLLLQVDDGSGEPLLPGAQDYEQAIGAASDATPDVTPTGDDLYILYTGGTTGMPKGVLWRQEDIFFAALGGRMLGGPEVGSIDELVERCRSAGELRSLPAPPFMHGAAHWAGFIMWHSGGTICLQENTRTLDPHDVWRTVERERIMQMSIVGDAFARPLLDQLAKGTYDVSTFKVLGSGGAILSAPLKQAFLEAIPGLIIFDGFGSSETGAQGSTVSMKGMEGEQGSFKMDDHTCVLDAELTRRLEPGDESMGWLARAGRVPLGYLGDEAKTRKTYPTVGGTRYAVPGDRAQLSADGQIRVFGRDSVCINSGGEKIFAEEVEQALKHHPAVYDVIVTGTPNARWGEQVTALVKLRPDAIATDDELREAAATQIARYKLPKAFVFVDELVRAPSGKPDYRWAKETAVKALS
ncbi:MAG: acyl-CoA synthetase [Deltaproteobacteria bacterium]|nr:acyl-CoA synthetase [Deltaproteobacteria bacterium]